MLCQSPLPSASSVGSDESINSCKSKNRELKFGTEIINYNIVYLLVWSFLMVIEVSGMYFFF